MQLTLAEARKLIRLTSPSLDERCVNRSQRSDKLSLGIVSVATLLISLHRELQHQALKSVAISAGVYRKPVPRAASVVPLCMSSACNSRTACLVLRRVLVRIWIFESFGKGSATSLQVHWLSASRICVATQAENELQLLFMYQTFGHQSEVSTHLGVLAAREGFLKDKRTKVRWLRRNITPQL